MKDTNSLNRDREEKETRIELLKKDFVAWRKKWLEEWSINGCPGGENKPDNHYLLFYWFEEKLEEAKAEEKRRCLEAVKGLEIIMTVNRVGLDGKRTENNLISLDQAISAITNNKQDERQSNSKGR